MHRLLQRVAGGALIVSGIGLWTVAAPAQSCAASNLLEAMRVEAPADYDELRLVADAVPNGTGIFWKIEKPGLPPSWLLGTMHSTDPWVTDLPGPVIAALERARVLVVELTEVDDPAAMAGVMASNPGLFVSLGGNGIAEALNAEDEAALTAALAVRGVDLATASLLQPWVIAAALSVSSCDYARASTGAPVLDALLIRLARKAGLQLAGLETIQSQLQAIASLGPEMFVRSLADMASMVNADLLDAVFETNVEIYLDQDLGMMLPFNVSLSTQSEAISGDMALLERELIEARNATMAAKAAPHLASGGAFVAVGGLHLIGETGLVEAFRRLGYAVSRQPLNR
jgi:uncharacterized protein YbaP (TraB family)